MTCDCQRETMLRTKMTAALHSKNLGQSERSGGVTKLLKLGRLSFADDGQTMR